MDAARVAGAGARRYPRVARVGAVLAILLAAATTTFTAALVLLSVTQPAVVVGVLDNGTMGALLRTVVVFVASGLAHLLRYL